MLIESLIGPVHCTLHPLHGSPCLFLVSATQLGLVMVSRGTSLPASVWHSTFWLMHLDLERLDTLVTKNICEIGKDI